MIEDDMRISFHKWIAESHTDKCRANGMIETPEHEKLVESVNKYLLKRYSHSGEYLDEEVQAKWEGFQRAHEMFSLSRLMSITESFDADGDIYIMPYDAVNKKDYESRGFKFVELYERKEK